MQSNEYPLIDGVRQLQRALAEYGIKLTSISVENEKQWHHACWVFGREAGPLLQSDQSGSIVTIWGVEIKHD